VEKLDIPQGTLDLMILTILSREPMHGYGISQRLTVLSRDHFRVNPGSLFPSLYRLEQDGKLRADWRATENNRRAQYYRLTASGRRQLAEHRERWHRVSFAVTSVLEGA
jgi:PadR family transcriptional regulator PadR